MADQARANMQRYSAQIRASQYDPDVDVAFYNHHATSPQGSQGFSRPFVNYHDHCLISSSDNSTATAIINPTSQNNGPSVIADPSSSSDDQILTGNSPSSTPPILEATTNSSPTNRGSTPSSTGSSNTFFTKISSSVLRNSKPNAASSAPQPQSQSQTFLQGDSNPQFVRHHQMNESTASVRSRLVAKGSRSSLQLNLRTNQQSQYPTMALSSGLSPSGALDDSSLAPSPLHQRMDPAFVKEHQMRRTPSDQEKMSDRHLVRMGTQNSSVSRQEDGRLQLEQEREFQKARRYKMWTKSKLVLFLANTLLLLYSVGWTVVMVMSWKGTAWTKPHLDSGIMMIANRSLLYLMMVAAPCGVVISIMGYVGIFAQNRMILSLYTILLWPLFGLITSIGYISFRRNHVSLYQKLKFSWISEYTRDDRLIIQNALSCCGYRSQGDYPSYDLHCFPRAPLPSCESAFLSYQQELLSNTSSTAFSVLLIQLLIMLVALLCSNHVDNLYRSANPITPKLYTQ